MKFKKYLKFIVSFVLIGSLSMPYMTYAGLDGSNHVTQAEFASALSDFNSRLTSFESSVNAKIDTQVTSYLERNGIWSRADMVLNSTNFTYDPVKKSYKRTLSFDSSYKNSSNATALNTYFNAPDNWGQLITAIIGVYDVDTGHPSVYNKNFKPIKVVDNITKSGLMHVIINISNSNDKNMSGSTVFFDTSLVSSFPYSAPIARVSLCFGEGAENATSINLTSVESKGSILLMRLDWFNTAGYAEQLTGVSSVEIGTYTLYFFVSKGNSLWQFMNGSGGFNYFSAADKWADARTSLNWNAGNDTLPIVVEEKIGVY